MSPGLHLAQAIDPQRGEDDCPAHREQHEVGAGAPDQQVEQQAYRHRHVVHHRQRAGIHQRGALVPAELAQGGGQHPHPDQYRPLCRRGRQLLRIAEQQPRG